MSQSSRKAQNVSITAFVLSLVFFIFTSIFSVVTSVLGVYLLSWQILAGLLVWGMLIAQFYQRHLAEQERLDMDRLRQQDQGTIFSDGGGRMAMLAVAQKRLVFLEKWILPIWAVVIAVYEILIGIVLYRYNIMVPDSWANPDNYLLGAVLMLALSFVSFLFSRYATGLSAEKAWNPLRSGASYLLATSVIGFALAASLALAQYKYPAGLNILKYLIPGLIILLGIETLLNAILDIYRPRVAGQYNRAAFDSRILGLFSEPGGILNTVAHTMDYQFGFKVSQTWFYQLLEKAVMPLILFAVLVLYLMSSFVVVNPGERAVVERFGHLHRDLEPGLRFKYPWPIEKVYQYPVDQIQLFNIGYKASEDQQEMKAFLWGEKHYDQEYNLLVAVQTDGSQQEEGAVPVSIVQANVPIQYRISDIRQFIYNHKDSRELLESICYRELTRYAISASIETYVDEQNADDAKPSLLGAGRMKAGKELHKRIQDAADREQLGVELVMVGLQGIHPPQEVAKEYEDVVASVQEKQATVLNALAERNKVLTELAGSIAEVDNLYRLALDFESSKSNGDQAKSDALREQLQDAFGSVKGTVFKTLREAEGYAYERINLAKGEGLRFAGQVKAYQAAPDLYQKTLRLLTLEEGLKDVRKYVIVPGPDDTQVYQVDLQEKLAASVYNMDLGIPEEE